MASPLPDLHYTGRPQSYSMISPNDPTANACKVVEFHGEKIAAFHIHVSSTLDRSLSRSDLLTRQFPQGKTMLCLPQAFELFLKNLVGGLHTVYTKCKRYFPSCLGSAYMRLHFGLCFFVTFHWSTFLDMHTLSVQVQKVSVWGRGERLTGG